MTLDGISQAEVGERLRIAREAVAKTQADAAAEIDVARTTLVAIEKGQRRLRTAELQKLAHLYSVTVNALLRREAVHVDVVPRFRKMDASPESAEESAAVLLGDLVKAEVELENLLGIKRVQNYPPERPIMPGNIRAQAENDAADLRHWLGLGAAPVRELVTLLELEMGVRIYVRPMNAKISGLFAYDEMFGAFILLNAQHPLERRTQTLAHELGHLVSTRFMPDVLHENEPDNSREEKYANAFARAFLTPPRAVMQRFKEVTAGAERLTRRHIILLAHTFAVSREAMVRRLEELKLTKPGTWDWFDANGGITNEQARQVLGELHIPTSETSGDSYSTTLRLDMLAEEAWRRELLSEEQLARLLKTDRVELRQKLDRLSIEGSEAHELPELPE